MGERVFVDADILFSRTLRDWLFLLRNAHGGGAFTVGSSEDVIAELLARYRDKYPKTDGAAIASLRQAVLDNLDELVEDYAVADWMLEGDPGDGHVRAAAVQSGFTMLLTCDKVLLSDDDRFDHICYEPIHPDDFLVLLDDSSPARVRAVTEQQFKYFMGRNGQADLPAALRRAGCPSFAARITAHMHALMAA